MLFVIVSNAKITEEKKMLSSHLSRDEFYSAKVKDNSNMETPQNFQTKYKLRKIVLNCCPLGLKGLVCRRCLLLTISKRKCRSGSHGRGCRTRQRRCIRISKQNIYPCLKLNKIKRKLNV